MLPDPFCAGSTNYNRDIDAFPLVRKLMRRVASCSDQVFDMLYSSPTSMGVNRASAAITNMEICCHASKREIAIRTLQSKSDAARAKCEALLKELGIAGGPEALLVKVGEQGLVFELISCLFFSFL